MNTFLKLTYFAFCLNIAVALVQTMGLFSTFEAIPDWGFMTMMQNIATESYSQAGISLTGLISFGIGTAFSIFLFISYFAAGPLIISGLITIAWPTAPTALTIGIPGIIYFFEIIAIVGLVRGLDLG